ncbi:3' terminal RNA ribose 2'-O-methyltransferase Hen1 [Kribbella sp. CA-294648]|uniref:3' terminal RNA ribose 2'-O-methyltransferase Hen1 n=1 Tax=Kribbella sp. CA-294648 TaxID=3239948 RepID=UPI003D8FD179
MFLTIATRTIGADVPATDLGFLLHKNPARPQSVEVAGGVAHVVYPEATAERCTAAVLLEVDPIALVRSGKGRAAEGFTLGQYVNDRPYAASSLLAVALGKLFRTAMNGRCDARPELAGQSIPLEIHLPALPCRGGVALAGRFFEPLGWSVDARPIPLDPEIPSWGDSRYVDLRLTGVLRLADALNHLYVLLPVLDDTKHYWVGTDEVDKLIRAGEGWLGTHPEKALISRRYLAHRRTLTDTALERLTEADGEVLPEDPTTEVGDNLPGTTNEPVAAAGTPPISSTSPLTPAGTAVGADAGARSEFGGSAASSDSAGSAVVAAGDATDSLTSPVTPAGIAVGADAGARGEFGGSAASSGSAGSGSPSSAGATPPAPTLAAQRRLCVLEVLREIGGRRVGDLGCGEGVLVGELLKDGRYDLVVATDVSSRALGFAERRLHVDEMSDRQRERLRLFQSSVTYADARLAGLDAAVLMEVVEHVDPPRLPALAKAVFGAARPGAVVVTTPNSEYNVRFETLPAGEFRHPDHRFEWTRGEFHEWAESVCRSYGYSVEFRPVGPDDPEVGPPTQLALFRRKEAV